MAKRVFIALMVVGPDGAEEPAALELQRRVRAALGTDAPVRLQAALDLHLTLFFAGEVEDDLVALLARALELACAGMGSCDLRMGSTGVFPEHGRPRVLWAGLQELGPPRLDALQQVVAHTCASLGLAQDARPWRPHVTLGRVRGSPLGMRLPDWGLPEAFAGLDPRFSWRPSHVALVESLTGGGQRACRVLRSLPLEGAAQASPGPRKTQRRKLEPPPGPV